MPRKGFCDSRDPEISILRPMRDFMWKEVAFYNVFLKLESVFIPSLGTRSTTDASIQRLTSKFITELQNDFPATVSTVFRTGEKLSLANHSEDLEESCALCQAPLDTTTLASSARFATDFSRMVSTLGPAGFDSQSIGNAQTLEDAPKEDARLCSVPSDGGCGCHTSSSCGDPGVTWAEAEEFLCYGCRLISRELEGNSSHQLPGVLLQRIKERSNYKHMRTEIQDFLL